MEQHIKILLALGVLIVLVPFLGIPVVWKPWLAALFGLGIVVLSYKVLRDRVVVKKEEHNNQQSLAGEHDTHA